MSAYDAAVLRGPSTWDRNLVTLVVKERRGTHAAFLMPDGTWQDFEEGAVATDNGLILPAGSIEAIARAIEEFQGHASHAETEARVLREWLAVERARVDKVLP